MNALADDLAGIQRAALLERLQTSTLPEQLKTTDRILQRWAASIGDGTPDHDEIVLASRVVPLSDDVAILVDKLVLRSPYRKLTEIWYRTPVSVGVIADKLRIHESEVRPTWRTALRQYQMYFEGSLLSQEHCSEKYDVSALIELRELARFDVRQSKAALNRTFTDELRAAILAGELEKG